MFTKHSQTTVSFDSSWKTEQQVSSGTSQTEPLEMKDQESQVLETDEVSVQTDKEETPDIGSAQYDEASLLSFLQRVTPQVEKELKKSARSRAFDGYSDLDDATNTGSKCIHVLRWQHMSPEHVVIDIGWSCTGSIIGVGYGVRLHDDWCSHKGAVGIWNINRNDFAANAPEQVLEVSTCVTCIAFHPVIPSYIGVGNMAGEVMVFDLSKTQVATPTLRGDSGGVAITKLLWVSIMNAGGPESRSHFKAPLSLVCTTAEGTILAWGINQAKEEMTINSGYLVKSEDVPREVRSRVSDSGGVGLTCASFAPDDPSLFLLGLEGGAILVCSTLNLERSDESVGGIDLNKCVTSSLSPHAGRVLEVSLSKFHRHAVHTLGSDKNLRLYSLLQPNKPLSVIYSEDEMTCSQWSTSRPLIVAVGKVGGEICFYSFSSKNCEPVLQLPSPEKPSPLSALAFNKNNIKLIASGDHLGRVFIWQLSDHFISPSVSEQNTLADLVQISTD